MLLKATSGGNCTQTRNQITVREGKGNKDRVTMLPLSLKEPLREHLATVKKAHEIDLLEGFGNVELPFALEKKYPNAVREWKWQYVFVAPKRSIDPRTKIERRHHLDPSVLQKTIKEALRKAGIAKPGSCHTFRHSLPLIYWNRVMTFAPSRNCLATKTSARR